MRCSRFKIWVQRPSSFVVKIDRTEKKRSEVRFAGAHTRIHISNKLILPLCVHTFACTYRCSRTYAYLYIYLTSSRSQGGPFPYGRLTDHRNEKHVSFVSYVRWYSYRSSLRSSSYRYYKSWWEDICPSRRAGRTKKSPPR